MTATSTLADRTYISLKGRIERGVWPAGHSIPAEAQLQAELNVSRGTLRTALRRLEDAGLVQSRQGSGRRVLGGVSRSRGMMMRTVALLTNMGGSVSHFLRGQRESAVDAGVVDGLRMAGLNLLLLNSNEGRLSEEEFALLAENPPVGLVVTHPDQLLRGGSRVLDCLRELNTSVVAYGDGEALWGFDRAVSDHELGSYRLTQWLIGQGRRNILRLWGVGPDLYWMGMRNAGHERAMADGGLSSLPPVYVCNLAAREPTREAFDTRTRQFVGFLAEYLVPQRRIDSIMVASDPDAYAVAAACRLLGAEPNRDVLIVGYDATYGDLPERDWETQGPVATMDKHNSQIGEALVELLVNRLGGRLPTEPQTIRTEPELLVLRGEGVSR